MIRTSRLALRSREACLLRFFERPPPPSCMLSLNERFGKGGKAHCRCHFGGAGPGSFFYLNRCFAKGPVRVVPSEERWVEKKLVGGKGQPAPNQ